MLSAAGLVLAGVTPALANSAAGEHALLRQMLYGNTSARLEVWSTISSAPKHIQDAVRPSQDLLSSIRPSSVSVLAVYSDHVTFPQISLHLRRQGNERLLVYNHGHGGLPGSHESFAFEFLRFALESGFDIVLSSMPMTGINRLDPTVENKVRTKGRDELTPIAAPRLTEHFVFELVDDPDHWMHYFIDGAVVPASVLKSDPDSRGRFEYLRTQRQGRPGAYKDVNYVGLSGGATTGLIACAVHRFDRCILVAGVMPEHLRVKYSENFGDAEQISRSFYDRFSVATLLGIAQRSSGRLTLMYGDNDPCCFRNPSASEFAAEFPYMDIRVVPSNTHGYRARDLIELLNEVDRP